MTIPGIDENQIRLRELELKAHGFDLMREKEAVQERLNQLETEKNNTVAELQKLYQLREQLSQQKALQEQQDEIAASSTQDESHIVVEEKDLPKVEETPKEEAPKEKEKKKQPPKRKTRDKSTHAVGGDK